MLRDLSIATETISAEVLKYRKTVQRWNELPSQLNGLNEILGGAVVWLVRSTPEQAVRVRALAGDNVLCS